MQGKKHYAEKLFTSFQLSAHVPPDNFYRRLKGVLDLKWLYKATAAYYGTEGQKSIDPVVFFKLILVGYLENLNSDRKIIQHASMRLDILFFLGYDLDEELPWHSTISRTRRPVWRRGVQSLVQTGSRSVCTERHAQWPPAGYRQRLCQGQCLHGLTQAERDY
jgi:transposase